MFAVQIGDEQCSEIVGEMNVTSRVDVGSGVIIVGEHPEHGRCAVLSNSVGACALVK